MVEHTRTDDGPARFRVVLLQVLIRLFKSFVLYLASVVQPAETEGLGNLSEMSISVCSAGASRQ